MYKRELTQKIIRSLSHNPAVAILGPRQIGKTTLAHEIAKSQPSIYLDLENPGDFQKLKDPVHYLGLHADKLVILDEVQRYPDLFMSLRGIIDTRRHEGRGNGCFLVLGSASNQLLKQSSESLAGRIHYSELTGLNPFEIESPDGGPLKKLWMRGGFPSSYAASSDQASHAWRQDFIRTYLERNVPQLGPRIPASTLMRFWTMLAHTQGELLNASKLAGSLGVESVTVSRYLDLMVDLLLVRRLEPWHGNVKKRLVKSPRTYVRDSGIVHALLQIPDYEALLGHPVLGKSWEGFVTETIISALPSGVHPFFYRTSAGADIDLVIEFGLNDCWAVEIKASHTPSLKRGFHMACEDLRVMGKFVVYTGEDTFPIGNDTTVLSLSNFIEAVRKRAHSPLSGNL
ncbi:MAG: ATP-binding protein [Gammaproteobacteria bacterium]|nr:ATP-binding protein [Gammaproteobacteria bacterium]MYD77207.1 ATP-binding protein [Gammaproteobacteria bacterium]